MWTSPPDCGEKSKWSRVLSHWNFQTSSQRQTPTLTSLRMTGIDMLDKNLKIVNPKSRPSRRALEHDMIWSNKTRQSISSRTSQNVQWTSRGSTTSLSVSPRSQVSTLKKFFLALTNRELLHLTKIERMTVRLGTETYYVSELQEDVNFGHVLTVTDIVVLELNWKNICRVWWSGSIASRKRHEAIARDSPRVVLSEKIMSNGSPRACRDMRMDAEMSSSITYSQLISVFTAIPNQMEFHDRNDMTLFLHISQSSHDRSNQFIYTTRWVPSEVTSSQRSLV